MKKIVFALLMFAGIAHAEVTGNVSVTNDYRFRGISQTQNSTALQGGFDYTSKTGLYAGNWNSNVSRQLYTDSQGLESDLYVGFKKELVKGIKLDVGSYNYLYSQTAGKFNSSANTNELYAGVETGPFAVKYSRSISDYFGVANSKGTQYVQADMNVPVSKKLTANAHVGRTLLANHSNDNYTDMKFGVTYDLSGIALGAHYYTNTQFGTTAKAANTVGGEQLYKNAVVVSLSKAF